MKKFDFNLEIKKSGCYFIAEIGVNHENSLDLAEKIIKQAKKGGANAVKFQSYKADKIASKDSPYYWDLNKVNIKSQYKLFKKYDKFNEDHYIKIKKICDFYKINFASTPFDLEAVKFLDKLVPFFKIASADFNNTPLLNEIIKTKKPIVISTGACSQNEIDNFYKKICISNKNLQIVLMHCILSYPTNYNDANLQFINIFKKKYKNFITGYSDHTIPDSSGMVLTKAYELGATVIEKHFTLDTLKGKKNNDHFHSMNFKDLITFRENINILKKITGKNQIRKILNTEKKSRKNARRSVFSLGFIEKGEKITMQNTIAKRPGRGIPPDSYHKILNKKLKKNIKDDTLITHNLLA